MSEVILYNLETFAVLFEFDADTKEQRTGATKWTDKPVEQGADLTLYGHRRPDKYSVEGIITAWPFGQPHSALRVSNADAALKALAELTQPVGIITKWWADTVVISSDKASNSKGEGEALRFSISVQTIKQPTTAYTQIPASKLKARVRKRNQGPPGAGGAAAGKKPKKKTDLIYKALGAFGIGPAA